MQTRGTLYFCGLLFLEVKGVSERRMLKGRQESLLPLQALSLGQSSPSVSGEKTGDEDQCFCASYTVGMFLQMDVHFLEAGQE